MAFNTITFAALNRPMTESAFVNGVITQNWSENSINIYFTGQVTTNLFGLTRDPADQTFFFHYIIINDGYFHNRDPNFIKIGHLLEHEVCHFFARWSGVAFPPNGYFYDSGEHVPANSPHLLLPEFPYQLKLPGSSDQLNSEHGYIWDRVNRNLVFQ